MATSGTYDFNLTLEEIVEEAYDRCGLRARTGYDYTSAIRSLNLLLIEWNNKGTNFWTLYELLSILNAGSNTFLCTTDVFDVIELHIRTGSGEDQVDHPVTRISASEWANIPNKGVQGRPVNVWARKRRDEIQLHFWPTPDEAYTLIYWALHRMEDAGAPASNTVDVPYRFLPAMVSGLAAKIAIKRNDVDPNKVVLLQTMADADFLEAAAGDRERVSVRFRPWMRR